MKDVHEVTEFLDTQLKKHENKLAEISSKHDLDSVLEATNLSIRINELQHILSNIYRDNDSIEYI